MPAPIYVVDAFAEKPFTGNPAAICLLDEPREDAWYQAVAAEMKHAETAFVWPNAEGFFNLRWFTPAIEVDLCGHATLAAAHVLWATGRLSRDRPARFETKSGELVCASNGDLIEMDFPAEPAAPIEPPSILRAALPTTPVWIGQNRFDIFIQLSSAEEVRGIGPGISALAMLSSRGVIATAVSDDQRYDFVTRFFAPAAGVPEDDATGSAQCALGPFWAERLGKAKLSCYQASKRGAVLGVEARGDRVTISGKVQTVLDGVLHC